MILSYNDFIDSGLPTSDDIAVAEIEFAIKTIEHIIVKGYLTADKYADIVENPEDYQEALDGNSKIAGIKFSECNLVFAYLLVNKYRLTRFASVIKEDEHSIDPDRETLLQTARQYWEIGEVCLQEVCGFLNIDFDTKRLNNLVFDEYRY